jgi:hypothetical protein
MRLAMRVGTFLLITSYIQGVVHDAGAVDEDVHGPKLLCST